MKKIISILLTIFPFALNAQIVYTDVNPDSIVSSQYNLDLNNDGTPEFLVEKIIDGGINVVQISGKTVSDSIAGFYAGFPQVTGYAHAYPSGIFIGPSNNLVDAGVLGGDHPLIMEDAEWPKYYGRYLGLKFMINGERHFGWARIKIDTAYRAFWIMDYAYETTANTEIQTGNTTAVEEISSANSHISVFPNPCNSTATFTFDSEQNSEATFSVYDIEGRLLFSQSNRNIKQGKNQFTLNTEVLENGSDSYRIYFCKVETKSFSSCICLVKSN